MKISVMTLGCPTWDLETILTRAKEYGFDGVDFRGIQNDLDITKMSAFTTDLDATAKRIRESGLEVSGISSSIRVCAEDKRQENLDEAKRTIPVARALGAKNVRIFGGGDLAKHSREDAAKIGRDCIMEILSLPGAGDLSWNFETHDNWIKSQDCKLLLDVIDNPAFGALWDMGHTARVGGETPEQTYAAIGNRVRYLHCKDAAFDEAHPNAMQKGIDKGWRYVIPGTGQLPLKEALTLLKSRSYNGWVLFEHEKRWHPTLPEPEEIFPAFVRWVKPIVG